MTIRVDIVSDVVCPWCVIGYHQLAKAVEETGIGIDVHWHPFELNPHMGEDGENLRDHLAAKYGTTPEGSRKARARLTELGAELGFTFNYADDMRMVNTFRAHQLLHWAGEQGRKHDLKLALFASFFGRREDLNDIQVLVAVAASIGLDTSEAEMILTDRRFASTVREQEQFWQVRGIQGVPAMIFNEEHLVSGAQGADNYAAILRHLTESEAA
ncbi:MAG: DsbA family oxidoreductase [Alphaproteobacteria bacterium]|nr:DsbA family oxidoreductase [Alphaproteobacteria bacterium]